MYKENELAKQDWKTIVTMENLILINNKLSNRFWVETIETTNYL